MIQSNNCIIHANCPLLPPIVPTAFSELLPRKWKKKLIIRYIFRKFFCMIGFGNSFSVNWGKPSMKLFFPDLCWCSSFSVNWGKPSWNLLLIFQHLRPFHYESGKAYFSGWLHTNYTDYRKFWNYLKQLWKSWFQMNFFKIKIFMAIWN